MKIIINLYGKTADIAAPRHHLRLGCVAPHWKLNEWLRRRRIPARIHGPFFLEYDLNVREETLGPHTIWCFLSAHIVRFVEFLDPADEIRYSEALRSESAFRDWNCSGTKESHCLDSEFDPDCNVHDVRVAFQEHIANLYGGLPGQHRTITIA